MHPLTKMLRLFTFSAIIQFALAIYGGDYATIEEFPYQVHIRHFNRSICGGAIINKNTIITAAHCTDDLSAKWMSVRVGSDSKHEGGRIVQVAEIIQHEKYNALNKDNDISLLKLKHGLRWSTGVSPVELQTNGQEVPPGTEALISGWGATVEKHKITPETLRKVEVEVITLEDCRNYYKENPVTDRMLCAMGDGKDSCKGDSGGPLVAKNKLIGIVSWGRGCGRTKFPGVYTKISALHSWISKHSNKKSAAPAA